MTADTPDRLLVERLLEDGAWLRALARSVIADQATADDVAQDATVIALTRPPREAGALRGWLRRVVRNLATDAHRKTTRREAFEAAAAAHDADIDAAELVARWEIRRQVVDAVLALDEPYRTTLLLRFFEGLDLADVAARQHVPVDTVKTRQRRALEMLRARLAHLDDGAGRRGLAVLLVLAHPRGSSGPATAAAPLAASALGGIAMSAATKTFAAVVVLVAVGAGWWMLRDRGSDTNTSARDASAGAAATESASTNSTHARRRPAAEPAGPPVPSDLSAFAEFDPDRDLRGVVVDRDGHAVEGARVAAYRFDPYQFNRAASYGGSLTDGATIAQSKSAADGSFRLRLTPGAQTLVRVEAKGFAGLTLPGLETGQTVRVVLDPPTTLRVRVVDAEGAPCIGAVVVGCLDRPSPDRSFWIGYATTHTDGAVVVWEGVPRGRGAKVTIDVSPPPGQAPARAECVVEDVDVNETTVKLAAGRAIEGRVVDVEGNTPVGGARVFADPQRACLTLADSSGRFRVDGWSREPRWAGDAECRLVAIVDGYAPGWANVPGKDDAKPVTIEMRRGYEVKGIVVDAAGRPVVGAQVLANANDSWVHADVMHGAETDEKGAFRLGWLPRDAASPLSVRASGDGQVVMALTPPPKGEALLDLGTITLGPGRTVRGRVVDESGAPLPGMFVRLVDAADRGCDVAAFRTSSDDGRFAFDAACAGKHDVHVAGVGADRSETVTAIDVPADRDPDPLTIVFGAAPPKPPTKVVLATRIVDEDGQPVADVPIGVGYDSGGWTGIVKASGAGTLDVPCEQEPQYVSTRFFDLAGDLATRYLHQHVWLRPGDTSTTIVLRRAEPVTGTVVDAAGKPLHNAAVTAFANSRQVGFGVTDAEGRFAIGVPPGVTLNLEAHPPAPTYPPPTDVGELHGVAAGTRDVTIRVAPVTEVRSLDIVLVLPEGQRAGKCDVAANFQGLDQRKSAGFRVTFDAAGRARIEGLPRAPVELRTLVRLASDDDKTYTGLTLQRVDADATSVRVGAPGFRTIRGRVIDADGAPSPGASIFSTAAFNASSTVANADGVFALRVPSDAQPPFLVTATKVPYDRKAPFGGWEIVEDGSDRELTIVLRPHPPR